jgi:benzaldehyde dehydrogenase (NAD)
MAVGSTACGGPGPDHDPGAVVQTVNDEAVAPFGGVSTSGTGSRHGGPQANIEAFTETQWVTLRGDLPAYPF